MPITEPEARRRPSRLLSRALAGAVLISTLATAILVGAPAAVAASPAVVQSAGGTGSNATTGSSVAITATLGTPCTAGDTLIAFVTVGQQLNDAGAVAITPPGWTRLYEHAPSFHVAEYHGWFALSSCSGVSSATFTVSAPGNPDGTTGSVVLTEYSGLPSSPVVEFASNNGDGGGATSGTLTPGVAAPTGTVVLDALSLYAPSSVSSTPSGWTSAGSEGGSLPAWEYWQNGAGQIPAPSFSWSPASDAWEISMVFLAAGPASPPPNVVQESSGAFNSSSSWGVTVPQGVSTGDALVATILSDAARSGAGFEATTVTGGGVTWQQVTGFGTSSGGTAEIWAGFSSGGTTGSTTVTAGLRGSADGQMVVSEISGITGIDTTSTASGSNDAPRASITPTAGDFMVAGMAAPGTSLIGHPTPQWNTYSTSTSAAYAAEWWSGVPVGTTSPQWSIDGSSAWAVVVAAFTAGFTPTVTGVSPSSGSTAGGATITVTGANFTGATAVKFGTRSGTNVVVNGAGTSLTVTDPAQSAATVDVTVTTPGATSATSAADHFVYQANQITSQTGGYWLVASDGGIFAYNAPFYGSTGAVRLNQPIVGMAKDPVTGGYWLVASDGGIFAYNAPFYGSTGAVHLNKPIVGMAADPQTGGYWLVASDGGIFAYNAPFYGSTGAVHLNKPIVGMAADPQTGGYWLVASDGGIFSYHAPFQGSTGGVALNKPIVGMAADPQTGGYWLVASDGGIFSYNAPFQGSTGDVRLNKPIVGMAVDSSTDGYWLVASDGGIFSYNAPFEGSTGAVHLNKPIVGMAPD